jgi:hypothetical protein
VTPSSPKNESRPTPAGRRATVRALAEVLAEMHPGTTWDVELPEDDPDALGEGCEGRPVGQTLRPRSLREELGR